MFKRQKDSSIFVQMLGMAEGAPGRHFAGGAWDPNDSSRLATIAGGGLQVRPCTLMYRWVQSEMLPLPPRMRYAAHRVVKMAASTL